MAKPLFSPMAWFLARCCGAGAITTRSIRVETGSHAAHCAALLVHFLELFDLLALELAVRVLKALQQIEDLFLATAN